MGSTKVLQPIEKFRLRREQEKANALTANLKHDLSDKFGDNEPVTDESPKLASKKEGKVKSVLKVAFTKLLDAIGVNPKQMTLAWSSFTKKLEKPVSFGDLSQAEHFERVNDPHRKKLSDAHRIWTAIIPGTIDRHLSTLQVVLSARSLLVLEIDDGKYVFKSLTARLKELGIKCFVHTSFFHSNAKEMFTVYIPFDKPVTENIGETCARILDYFVSLLGEHINPRCRINNQKYLMPTCPPDAVKRYKFMNISGKTLKAANFMIENIEPLEIELGNWSANDRIEEDFNNRCDWPEMLQRVGLEYYFTGRCGEVYFKSTAKLVQYAIQGVVYPEDNYLYLPKRAKECQSALKIDPPSASKIDPPQVVVFSY